MAYKHNDSHYKHRLRAQRLRKTVIAFSGIIVLAIVFIGVDWVISRLNNSNTVVSRENTTSVQSANVSVYRTEYFQFQAPDEWVNVVSESTDTKFVYVKNKGVLVTQKIIIYLNRTETEKQNDIKNTYVLPVDIDEKAGGFVNIGKISTHCNDAWTNDTNRNPARVVHDTVSFVCSPDSKQYNVILGQYGGVEDMAFTLDDGRQITVAITYRDLTAYPTSGDIFEIASSFIVL